MGYADEQSYEEMIEALQTFIKDLGEECQVMTSAGQDCVDNTDNDPIAESNNSKLQSCVSKIQTAGESIQQIITALQQELEEIREAARKASQE